MRAALRSAPKRPSPVMSLYGERQAFACGRGWREAPGEGIRGRISGIASPHPRPLPMGEGADRAFGSLLIFLATERVRAVLRLHFAVLLVAVLGVQVARAADGPQRIVVLGSEITEIIFALGEGKRIVGRDASSVYPPEAMPLPDLGYFRNIGAEGALSLKPDLILASSGVGPPEALQQIAATGVALHRFPEKLSAEGLIDKVKQLATILGAEAKGAELIAGLQRDLTAAQTEIAALAGKPKVLFIIGGGGGAPLAAGRSTSADALITLAGGANIFATHEGYKPISLEAAAAAGPDAIAMMDHTLQAMGGVEGVAGNPALSMTPAAQAKRVVARGAYMLNFGPRLPKAMVDFARAIRGKEQM
jgi:iron complex transport system substrate-binding protein